MQASVATPVGGRHANTVAGLAKPIELQVR